MYFVKFLVQQRGKLHSSSLTTVHLQLLPLEFLLRNLLLFGFRWNLGKSFFFLNQTHFNVAWGGHEGVDTTVGSVRSPPHFGGTVNLDVFNDQVIGIQTLVFGVRFGIFKQIQQEFTRLLGPTTWKKRERAWNTCLKFLSKFKSNRFHVNLSWQKVLLRLFFQTHLVKFHEL